MAQSLSIIAAVLYLAVAYRQSGVIIGRLAQNRKLVLTGVSIAILFHWAGWVIPLMTAGSVSLSFLTGASLIALVINLIVLTSAFKKPLENLFIGLLPMATIIISLDLVFPNETKMVHLWKNGIVIHILLSIVAYSLLTIAAFQAVLVIFQDHQLKHKHMTGVARMLPPLQTMDKLLFEMIWSGMILLTGAIASGFIFIDDIFAQHLAHKTFLTFVAWGIFALLLFGRYQFGWRGTHASKWTLAGVGVLALAYFGSKLVLEIILNRV